MHALDELLSPLVLCPRDARRPPLLLLHLSEASLHAPVTQLVHLGKLRGVVAAVGLVWG